MSSPSSRLAELARTAWWTAAARGYESRRRDRLFNDPWATVLVGPHGVEEFAQAIHADGAEIGDLHAVTTRYFDQFLLRATGAGTIEQVVVVAAGLDTRAFRLGWPSDLRLFELDQPQVIAYKDTRLSLIGATPGCERRAIGVDLNGPWPESLCAAGFDPVRRSVWLLEGSLHFLAEPIVLGVLAAITDLAAAGSLLGLDVVNGAMVTSPATRRWNERMAAAGAPWLFTTEDPAALLAGFGWSSRVVQPGAGAANFGRLPHAGVARSEPAQPRSFLVTATRH